VSGRANRARHLWLSGALASIAIATETSQPRYNGWVLKAGVAAITLLACIASGCVSASPGDARGLHATAAASLVPPQRCAKIAPSSIAPNSWSATSSELVPAGASSLRLCRYLGLNARPPLRLARSVLETRPSLVSGIGAAFDSLPSPPPGPSSCPSDSGAEIVVFFAYPDGQAVTVGVRLSGCLAVTNGNLIRTTIAPSGSQLLSELKRLTRHRAAAE
jgi:hypothetical protein